MTDTIVARAGREQAAAPRHATEPRGDVAGAGLGDRIATCLGAIAYALLLWFDYKHFISPSFSYMSFRFYPHPAAVLLLDLVIVAAPCLFLPAAVRRPSDLALMFIYIIVYIPSIIIISAATERLDFVYLTLKLMIFLSFGVIRLAAGLGRTVSLGGGGMEPRLFMRLVIALALLCVAVIGRTYGYRIVLHDLGDVYGQRDAFKLALDGAGYNTYLIGILSHVLAPMMIGLALIRRSVLLAALGTVLELYVFSVTGLKSSVLTIAYIVAVFALVSLFPRRAMVVALLGSSAVLVLGMLASAVLHLGLINDLFARRTFVMQGLLTDLYYDYMRDQPSLLLSHSILRPLFHAPIIADPDDVIGAFYFSGAVHANSAIWADGYMNAKYAGIFIAAAVTGGFLAALDYCASRCDLRMACCSLAMTYMMICQTGIVKVAGVQGGMVAGVLILIANLRTAALDDAPAVSAARKTT